MHVFKKPSITSIYDSLISTILTEGELVETEFGEPTKELQNVVIQITNPSLNVKLENYENRKFRILRVPKTYPLGENGIRNYAEQILYGTSNNFTYNYHERLRKYQVSTLPLVDQIQYCIDKINNQPNTRRAISITWNPYKDCTFNDRDSVPCLQYIQFLKRNNNLYMTTLFRSNDMLLAFPSNALGLMLLGQYVAQQTNSQLKSYTHIAISAHVYIERDKDWLVKWVK